MTETLRVAAAAAFPGRTVEAIDEQTTRPGNEVGRVTFPDSDPVYLKTATDTTRRLVRETAATRYADRHCPVDVPEIRAADPGGDPPYLALAPMGGTPLNDPWTDDADRAALVRAAGRTLAGVHEARFDCCGTVEGGDADGLDLATDTWTETLCRTVEWRASDWYPDRFADVPERLVGAIRQVDPAVGSQPALVHADCSRINVYLDPAAGEAGGGSGSLGGWGSGGLLDWERALVGDPAFDLVDTEGHLLDQPDVPDERRDALRAALHAGYRERAGSLPVGIEDLRPLYRAVWHLLVTQSFEEWAPEVDQPTEDLAEQVREEFDDRLSQAREAV